MMSVTNPTTAIDLSFANYVDSRDRELSAHLVGGIPDYAFSLDQQLRQQLAAMGPVRAISQSLVAMIVPLQKQLQQMNGVAVGPQQYPEIYALGEDCARQLGIGVPQIFVYYSPMLNAYTIATDDVAPMVVLSSALVEAFEPLELKFVIGHECGHIHNLHSVYNTAVELMTNSLATVAFQAVPALGALRFVLQGGLLLFMMRWSRCAEVTCDRAGLICCGDLTKAQVALAKLATGGVEPLKGINIQEYLKQIRQVQSTPVRLLELTRSHPLTHKRIEAIRLFADCDVLPSWRPEMRSTSPVRSKAEIDEQCEQFIRVMAQGYQASA
ncbi:M48 family metallopeptidase [Romeria aff. gracilis LEGE 07310]|uniref:M48 family metallopeptidase n=1 Tax=Vasconcelosia minhoensis LEGE 07310 TaxID=915328 RepID=A0A8J7AEF7_9CYAN|nr:M48 family metallopeptidase [Romeria gracilis]MBE9075883.1 M48 family metallopeptidase [Romeria aff. gracilis LEGE 07310]